MGGGSREEEGAEKRGGGMEGRMYGMYVPVPSGMTVSSQVIDNYLILFCVCVVRTVTISALFKTVIEYRQHAQEEIS